LLHVCSRSRVKELRQLHVEQRGGGGGARACARASVRRGGGGGGVIQPRHRAGGRCGHAGADVVVAACHRAAPLLQVRRVGGLHHLHQCSQSRICACPNALLLCILVTSINRRQYLKKQNSFN